MYIVMTALLFITILTAFFLKVPELQGKIDLIDLYPHMAAAAVLALVWPLTLGMVVLGSVSYLVSVLIKIGVKHFETERN